MTTIEKKAGQNQKSTSSSSQKRKGLSVPNNESRLLMDIADKQRQQYREAFTKCFEYEMNAGSLASFEQDDICAACRDPMVSGKAYVSVKGGDVFEGSLMYHNDCFICSCSGCTHTFPDPDDSGPTFESSSEGGKGEDDEDTKDWNAVVYLDDSYMPYCPRPRHIPSTSKFTVVPRFHAVTHNCLNGSEVPEKWQDLHDFNTQFGFCILVPPFENGFDGEDPEAIQRMRTVIETNIEFTTDKKINNFYKGHEMRDVAKWPHKQYGFIGPYYKASDNMEKYNADIPRVGEGVSAKTEADVAEGAMINFVAQHKYFWDLRQKMAMENWYRDLLVFKEHVSFAKEEVSQEPGGEVNQVASVGTVHVIPACPDGTSKLKVAGEIQQVRFDAKRASGSGNKTTIKKPDGTHVSVKKKPRAYEIPAFMALTDATNERKGGMSVVFAPHRIKIKTPTEKKLMVWYTDKELFDAKADKPDALTEEKRRDLIKLKWQGEGKRPVRKFDSMGWPPPDAPEGHSHYDGCWVTMTKKVIQSKNYDWETFYLDARHEERSPPYGINFNSPFKEMKQFIPMKKGDVLVLQRSGMFAFEQGTRTQMFAYLGAGTMDIRKITKDTRILCALDELTTSTYNTFFYVHPAGLDGLGAAGCVWPGAEDGDPPPEMLSCPIGVSELYKYKAALCGTRIKAQKLPAYYARLQPKKSTRGRGTIRNFDKDSSVEIGKVPRPSSSKGKNSKGKMSDETTKSECPVTYDPALPILERVAPIMAGGSRKFVKNKKKGDSITYAENENFEDVSNNYNGFDAVRFYPNGPDNEDSYIDFVFPDEATEKIEVLMKSVNELKPEGPMMLQQMGVQVPEPRLTTVIGKEKLGVLKKDYMAVPEDENTEKVMEFVKEVEVAFNEGFGEDLEFDQVLITYYRTGKDWNRARQESFYINPDQRSVVHFVKGGAGRVIRFRWAKKGYELDLTIPEYLANTGFFYITSSACQEKATKENPVGVYHEIPEANTKAKKYMSSMGDEYEPLCLVQMHKAKDPSKEPKKKKRTKATSKKPTKKMHNKTKTKTKTVSGSRIQVARVKGSKQKKTTGYGTMLNSITEAATKEALMTSQKAPKGSDERHLFLCYNAARKTYKKFIAGKKKESDLLQDFTAFSEAIPEEKEDEDSSSSSSEEEEIGFVAGGDMDEDDSSEEKLASSSTSLPKKKEKVLPPRESRFEATKKIKITKPEISKKLNEKQAKKALKGLQMIDEKRGDGEFKKPKDEDPDSEEFEEDDNEEDSSISSSGEEEEEDVEDVEEVDMEGVEGVEGDGSSVGEEEEEEDDDEGLNIKVTKKSASSGVSEARAKRESKFASFEKQLDKIEQSHPVAMDSEMAFAARTVVLDAQKDCEDNACGLKYLKAYKAAIVQYKEALSTATREIKEKAIADKKRLEEKKRKAPAKSSTKTKRKPKATPTKKKAKTKVTPTKKKTEAKATPTSSTKKAKTKATPTSSTKKAKTKATPTSSTKKAKVTPTKKKRAREKDEDPSSTTAKTKPSSTKKKKVKEVEEDDNNAAAELELLRVRQARMMKEMPVFMAMTQQFNSLGEQVPDLLELDKDDLSMYRGARKHLSGLLTQENFEKHGAKIPGAQKALQEFEKLIKKISKKRKRDVVVAEQEQVQEEKEEEEGGDEEVEHPEAMEVVQEEDEAEFIANYKVEEEEDELSSSKKKAKTKEVQEEDDEGDSSSEDHEPGSGAYLVFDAENYLVAYVSEGVDKAECTAWLSEQGLDKDDYYIYFNPSNKYCVGDTVAIG